jgi:hypothetical protein
MNSKHFVPVVDFSFSNEISLTEIVKQIYFSAAVMYLPPEPK